MCVRACECESRDEILHCAVFIEYIVNQMQKSTRMENALSLENTRSSDENIHFMNCAHQWTNFLTMQTMDLLNRTKPITKCCVYAFVLCTLSVSLSLSLLLSLAWLFYFVNFCMKLSRKRQPPPPMRFLCQFIFYATLLASMKRLNIL